MVTVATGPMISELPPYLQPGEVVTMQPVDAPESRDAYIYDDAYWGQAKRDGQRCVVIGGKEGVYYQSRPSLKTGKGALRGVPAGMHACFLRLAEKFGAFVLDGEIYYADANGKEHRTAPQADTANKAICSNELPRPRYAIFKALYVMGSDLTTWSEKARIELGEMLGDLLVALRPDMFEVLPTARTIEEKKALAEKQKDEGREGEIWVRWDCKYVGGKDEGRNPPIVRTKYIQEHVVIVIGLTPTKAVGRPFGAIETSMGRVGTGYTVPEMREIAQAFEEAQRTFKPLRIEVAAQGLTETGKLWHGRFRKIITEERS